jgi:HSP20 family molecular chaperone IbpA
MTDDRLPLAERSYGLFKRQLTLPADVDPDAIVAKHANGILKLELKKDKKAASRVRKNRDRLIRLLPAAVSLCAAVGPLRT